MTWGRGSVTQLITVCHWIPSDRHISSCKQRTRHTSANATNHYFHTKPENIPRLLLRQLPLRSATSHRDPVASYPSVNSCLMARRLRAQIALSYFRPAEREMCVSLRLPAPVVRSDINSACVLQLISKFGWSCATLPVHCHILQHAFRSCATPQSRTN